MKQVLIIHGGNSFSKYADYLTYLKNKQLDYNQLVHSTYWKESLSDKLPDFDIILPSMPNSQNAVYEEWKIYFEKLLAMLKNDVQIIGHSLGAMFLAQYLQDNPFTNPVKKLILVAGGYNDEQQEDLGSFKVSSATNLQKSAKEIHLFHSEDDPVVPFSELAKFQADLPAAISHVFKDRGHFISETFPEIIQLLKEK